MIGDLALEAGRHPVAAQNIHEEGDELVALGRERHGAAGIAPIIGQELGKMGAQHAGAGAAGRHHMVEALEQIDHLAGDGMGGLAIAGIIGGLAAAGLKRRRLDQAARLLQELGGGQTHAGTEKIDEAGDEESDADGQASNPYGRVAGWRAGGVNASRPAIGVC